MYKNETDKHLIFLLSSEVDKDAWRELYERHHLGLYRFLLRFLNGNEGMAEDIVQDVFVKIYDKAHQYNSKFAFSTWLFNMATNQAKNEWKKNSRNITSQIPEAQHEVTPEEILDAEMKRQKIDDLLLELSPEHRETYILRYQQGFSTREVAEVLDISEGTVKSRLFKATQLITKYFKKWEK
jgi:RNA polymerase sigma-70 factor (ECF subfamily)